MKHPEIILAILSNQDAALFVNGTLVSTFDMAETETLAINTANKLAGALDTPVHRFDIDVPTDDDWNWNDVYELLPATPTQKDSVPVRYWNAYSDPEDKDATRHTHELSVDDQRQSNGQMYADFFAHGAPLESQFAVTLEISEDPNGNRVPCAHVHFDDNGLAFSLFKIGDKILLRPETDVALTFSQEVFNGIKESCYWVE